ncbi:MAG: sulfatase-like hydrolase/transferase [Roseibacillus sp.]
MKILLSFLLSSQIASSSAQPNVIYIKTDDQRFDALSMTGHPVTKTPHIDQLAKEGIFFDQAFITSPVCGPSRANTFSGQWERKNRVGFSEFLGNNMKPEVFDQSWLMCLKRAGYFTGYIGKHHVGIGEKREKGYLQRSIDFAYLKKGHIGFHLNKIPAYNNLKNQTQVEGLLEATDAFLDPSPEKDDFFDTAHASVKDFLQRRDDSKPFAVSINFNLPHAASIGGMGAKESDPEYYRSLYQDQLDKFPIPKGFVDKKEPFPKEVFQLDELMGYYKYNKKTLLNTQLKMARANYAIDLFVGSIREQLSVMGVAENTIIVFASDHGLLLGEKGLGGKTFLYEDSVHIPLIFYSPLFTKEEASRTISDLVVGQDIPATILDLCGVEIPKTYQGVSMLPLIEQEPVAWRQDIFLENLFTKQGYPRMEAVRSKEWKYIRYFSRKNDRAHYLPEASLNGEQPIFEELYHLTEDPKEAQNLAASPEHQAILANLRQRCQELLKECAQ